MERFNPAVLELGRRIAKGWVGTLYSITSRRAGPFPARIRDVGVTIDLATHDADILSWVAGERPTRVYAETAQRLHATNEDLLFGLLHFPSGATGMLDVNWLTPAKRRQLTVVGEAGMFELDYLTQRLTFTSADVGSPTIIDGYATTFEGNVVDVDVASREPLAAELDAFLAVARDGGRPVVDGEDGLWALAIASSLLQAAAEAQAGRPGRLRREDGRPMTITTRPTTSATVLGGTITLPQNPCLHAEARHVQPWTGEEGTAGTVTVVGAGKMGLPLAAQFASHGWSVIAVDVNEAVVAALNEGRAHVAEEPDLAERVAAAHAAGRLRATTDGAAAARESDVVVLIVPVMLDDEQHPDYRHMDAAADAIAPGVRAGTTVIFETTLPVGDTRSRYAPAPRGGDRPRGRPRLLRRLLAGAAVHRRRLSQPRDLPEARRRHRPGVDGAGSALLRVGPRRGGRGDEHGGGGRAEQARRHDVPRPEHRLRQRAGPLRRPDRGGRPRGDPGREQPAVQPYPRARPWRGRPLHPGLPALPPVAGPGDGARGTVAAGERRPGGYRDPDGSRPSSDRCRTSPSSSSG